MKIWIVTPCFFDTMPFARIRGEALAILRQAFPEAELQFVLIDDTAGQDLAVADVKFPDVQVVTPPYNLGHQGALVFTLRDLGTAVAETDYIVTMDSDGEDRPQDLEALLQPLITQPDKLTRVSVAVRTRRSERLPFKLFYAAFKVIFYALTGTVIRNGNFAAYRGWFLKEVIFHPHFDQCYSSSFISLPMHLEKVPLARGPRYAGRSRMGYMGLLTHGLRMLMPFSERIATRGIVASVPVMGLSLMGLAVGLARGRVYPIPFFMALVGILTLGISILLFATFSQTKARSLRGLNPLKRYP